MHGPRVRRGRLPRWVEYAIAGTAFITSTSSIFIAVHHGEIMERLVQANSFPYMQGGFSDITPEGEEQISLDLLNRGVGPAHQRSLHVNVDHRNVRSLKELIAASLTPEQATEAVTALKGMRNGVKTRLFPAALSATSRANSCPDHRRRRSYSAMIHSGGSGSAPKLIC